MKNVFLYLDKDHFLILLESIFKKNPTNTNPQTFLFKYFLYSSSGDPVNQLKTKHFNTTNPVISNGSSYYDVKFMFWKRLVCWYLLHFVLCVFNEEGKKRKSYGFDSFANDTLAQRVCASLRMRAWHSIYYLSHLTFSSVAQDLLLVCGRARSRSFCSQHLE